ncbi:helix-turn-helix transcriptional regulator [Bacillus subtilis]|uniref:helix-turn-helix domain-containing protein n=1 Tax=Bacillus subtilis TaxID=1423 RepID=UPI002DBEFE42|nr:helix-turn-helix transcriptional regulator [Bacillus subtilis]MEC2335140.1 helix-turn-helix transcriptional regulator [Bacillus subtilis]
MSEFGDRLKELRKSSSKKISQEEAGRAVGVSRTAYANYEHGNREPDLKTLTRLSDYYRVSLDYLIKGDEVESNNPDLSFDRAVFTIKDAIKDIENKSSHDVTISYLSKVSREDLASDERLKKAVLKATKKIIDNEIKRGD